MSAAQAKPQGILSVFDAVTMLVGLVIGVGIFRTPSLIAGNVDSAAVYILLWVLGALVTLVGALCYAELSAAHPHAGGEYHFLSRAYGKPAAMLFGWARCTVIQTGAIAGVAFLLGDYLSQLAPLGRHGPAIYAALAVAALTCVNVFGAIAGKNLQVIVTAIEIGVIVAIIVAGLAGATNGAGGEHRAVVALPLESAGVGMAMIFILLTYGGWNEAAYLGGELRDAPRNIARVLIAGTAILGCLYTLANVALLAVLGLEGLRQSNAVAADMMRAVAGPAGERIVTVAIVVSAISTLNATMFTGARGFFAMAQDVTVMRWIGVWDGRGRTPANGQIAQGLIALALIALGAVTRDGFKAMVDYTAPVFWGFLLLTGLALFVLRWRHPARELPYRVPFYPLTPILFCLTCLYMFYASVTYTGMPALVGLAVLLSGVPLLLFRRRRAADVEHAGATATAREPR